MAVKKLPKISGIFFNGTTIKFHFRLTQIRMQMVDTIDLVPQIYWKILRNRINGKKTVNKGHSL